MIAAIAACNNNYRAKYAGNNALQIQNRSNRDVRIRIYPAGNTRWIGNPWGDVKSGRDAVFKIQSGKFTFDIDGIRDDDLNRIDLDIQGSLTVVIADQQMPVPPNTQLVLIRPQLDYSDPNYHCVPNGAIAQNSSECCSNSTRTSHSCSDGTMECQICK